MHVICPLTWNSDSKWPVEMTTLQWLFQFDKKCCSDHRTLFPLWDGLGTIVMNGASHTLLYFPCRMLLLHITRTNQIRPTSEQCGKVTSHSCKSWKYDISLYMLGSSFRILGVFSFLYRMVVFQDLRRFDSPNAFSYHNKIYPMSCHWFQSVYSCACTY